jgi:hypothetical protein
MATQGGSLEGNEGAIWAELSSDPTLAKALKGHGAGAVGLKGAFKAVAGEEARKRGEQAEFEGKNQDELTSQVQMMGKNEQMLAHLTTDLVSGAKDFDTALKTLTSAIMDSLTVIAPAKAAELRKQAKENADKSKEKAGAPGSVSSDQLKKDIGTKIKPTPL